MLASKNAEYRREDYFFSRQQSQHSPKLEKTVPPRPWLHIGGQIIGWGIILFLISQLILFFGG